MTDYRLVEAKPWHCGQMVRRLYAERQPEILRSGMAFAHAQMRTCFDASAFRRTWLIDDQIAVIGGVCGSMLAATGYLWLSVSDLARRHRVAFIREARQQMDVVMYSRRDLAATIVNDDDLAERRDIRFATFLGFEVSSHRIAVAGKPSGALTFRYRLREVA